MKVLESFSFPKFWQKVVRSVLLLTVEEVILVRTDYLKTIGHYHQADL